VLQQLFFLLIVRPLVLIVLGLNVRHRERLPRSGPAIIVSNHNSHLDILVLMTLLPWRLLSILRPVGAKDYFFAQPLFAWLSTHVMHMIPLTRQVTGREDPLAGCDAALRHNQILILFPEGSRGHPERMTAFKAVIAH
jgi:1-acyl-sn-glycerol-3-phosphate acyltransferase